MNTSLKIELYYLPSNLSIISSKRHLFDGSCIIMIRRVGQYYLRRQFPASDIYCSVLMKLTLLVVIWMCQQESIKVWPTTLEVHRIKSSFVIQLDAEEVKKKKKKHFRLDSRLQSCNQTPSTSAKTEKNRQISFLRAKQAQLIQATLSSWGRCSSPLIIFVAILWIHSNSFMSFLCWGPQAWM